MLHILNYEKEDKQFKHLVFVLQKHTLTKKNEIY